MKWIVEFLNATAEAEVDRLPHDMRAALVRVAALIEEYGLESVGMPYIRHVQGKMWELRLKGRDGIARSLYVSATGCRVVILRTFIKKTPQTPRDELQLALKRAKEVL